MSTKYLDYDGLSHFWTSIKNLFATKTELNGKKNTQTAVSSPSASGYETHFIDTISQDAQGVITATKKTVPQMSGASASAAGSTGLVPAPSTGYQNRFLAGDGTWQEGAFASDLANKKDVQTAKTSPSASGNSVSFIDTISQDAQGVITATKKTVSTMSAASSSAAGSAGLVPAPASGKQSSFLRGDATWQAVTDTKNTAGSTNKSPSSSEKLYLIGATSQAANPQTYSNSKLYLDANGLHANGINGYTLAAACAKGVDTSIASGSSSTNLPTSAAVDSAISAAIAAAMTGSAVFKGAISSNTAISNLSAYSAGWYWLVSTAGTYVGKVCEAGDMIYCISNRGSAYSASDFTVVQTNLDIATISNSEIDTILAS